jgi:hypothetical protein
MHMVHGISIKDSEYDSHLHEFVLETQEKSTLCDGVDIFVLYERYDIQQQCCSGQSD